MKNDWFSYYSICLFSEMLKQQAGLVTLVGSNDSFSVLATYSEDTEDKCSHGTAVPGDAKYFRANVARITYFFSCSFFQCNGFKSVTIYCSGGEMYQWHIFRVGWQFVHSNFSFGVIFSGVCSPLSREVRIFQKNAQLFAKSTIVLSIRRRWRFLKRECCNGHSHSVIHTTFCTV